MTTSGESYRLTAWLFLRGLGLIYLIAFLSFYLQYKGLIGEQGILPFNLFLKSAQTNLGTASYILIPAINWINSSEMFMHWQLLISIGLSVLLIAGIFPLGISILLWVSYLSVVNVGQIFMSYQWDVLLLETGFLSIFISSYKLISKPQSARAPSPILIFLFRILLFKLMFSSGIGKLLSGDEAWRNLTALDFHYFTQPIPNPISWYLYQPPHWFHKLSVLITLVIEIIVPFFYFVPGKLRRISGYITIIFQLIIMASGNYTFFNLIAIFLCMFLYDDEILSTLIPYKENGSGTQYKFLGIAGKSDNAAKVALVVFAVLILCLNALQFGIRYFGLREIPKPLITATRYISGFRIVNNYGLFTVMTTERPEIVIQGSNDGIKWSDYEFRYKPGDPKKSLRFVAPHQPRLDWQMWFAALGDYRANPWIINLLYRLKSGSAETIDFFWKNPFPDTPPVYLRTVIYNYKFTTIKERKETGAVWKREYRGLYLPVIIK